MADAASPTTRLLQQMHAGDAGAADQLLPLVYDELRRIAGRLLGQERSSHTLQPTALIHEAFLRLVEPGAQAFDGRVHFLRVAARAMRNVLVDHARAHIEQTFRRPLLDRLRREFLARLMPYPARFRLSLHAAMLAKPFRPIFSALGLKRLAAMLALAACSAIEPRLQEASPLPEPPPEKQNDNLEMAELLDRELSRLPEKYRVPLILCELQNHSRKEAAALLGIPEGTLSSRLATAKRKLARQLARYHPALSASALGVFGTAQAAPPVVPPALIADIAGGTFPAVINILLALRSRDQSGQGVHLDIAMTDAMFTFAWYALALGQTIGRFPKAGELRLTGGSPRYQLYPTKDGKLVASADLRTTVPNQLDCLVRLQLGEVDAVVTDGALAASQAAQDPTVELKGDPFTTEYYGVAMSKESPDLVRRVNQVLVDYRKSDWDKAYEKWLADDLNPSGVVGDARRADAAKGDRLLGPQPSQHLDLLLDAAAAVFEVLVEYLVLHPVAADTDSEAQSPAAQQVELGGLLGDQEGLALGQD